MTRYEIALAELDIWLADRTRSHSGHIMLNIGMDVLRRHRPYEIGGKVYCAECPDKWPCADVNPWLDLLVPEKP